MMLCKNGKSCGVMWMSSRCHVKSSECSKKGFSQRLVKRFPALGELLWLRKSGYSRLDVEKFD